MVVVDRFIKIAHFIGLPINGTTKDVADTLLQEIWKLGGCPSNIISNNNAKFSGEFWESLCKSVGFKGPISRAYYPQTDRQTEETTKCWKVTSKLRQL